LITTTRCGVQNAAGALFRSEVGQLADAKYRISALKIRTGSHRSEVDAKDIIAKRWMLAPPNPEHLAKLINLGLVEMRDCNPFVTTTGQVATWIPD
jgi:hypothetical protein